MPVFGSKKESAAKAAQTPAASPPPPALKSMNDFPAYVAAKQKLNALHAELNAAEGEAEQLRLELGRTRPTDETTLAAMTLLGQGEPGAATAAGAKHGRLKELDGRVQVLRRAAQLHTPVVDDESGKAWRQVMREASPVWRALLASHAEVVVNAARSRLTVLHFMREVEASSPAGAYGFGDHSFSALGDPRNHETAIGLWLAELIGLGVLTGEEAWLRDVAVIARRPDGSPVDRASRPAAYNMGRPAPAKKPWFPLTQPAAPSADNDPALPPTPQRPTSAVPVAPPPASKGPMATIRLLKDMVTATHEWKAGDVTPWAKDDAARMVKAGAAEWAKAPPAVPITPTPAVAEAAPTQNVAAGN